MERTRRSTLVLLISSPLAAGQPPNLEDAPPDDTHHRPPLPGDEPDPKLPNGKSQKNAIAEQQHSEALEMSSEMVELAQQVKGELQKAGKYVVPVSTIRKTEEIEKLARKIRGKLRV